ncbi:MAG: alpha/beta hydrolase [Paracoccaceae bacterium]
MIPGFSEHRIKVGDISLATHIGGEGPPLVLLHGFPQNHMCWAGIAPELARQFTCIVPDLRGYGASDAPHDDAEHTVYSKRQMAADIAALLDHLGHDKAHVLGHDRGARVAYRFALDHPDRIERLGIIEIVPTAEFWRAWDAELAMRAYHWTFLAQPEPLPEQMIGADPAAYMNWTLASWTKAKSLDPFTPDALESYREQAADPARIHAMCADYRAGATFDRILDEADRAAGRKITAPLKLLYADRGFPAKTGDPTTLWKGWATEVSAEVCKSGHFVMEENPEATLACFLPFFAPA